LIKKTGDRAFVQFPSTVVGIIPTNTFATKGMSKKLIIKKITKAGDSKLLGRIPKVRGIAMNPVDHPHGGRTNGGCHPRTPTGFLTKNVKTRKKK
jgi:large subunit ribosomal protein L2